MNQYVNPWRLVYSEQGWAGDYFWLHWFQVDFAILLCFTSEKKIRNAFMKSGRELMALEWLELEKSRKIWASSGAVRLSLASERKFSCILTVQPLDQGKEFPVVFLKPRLTKQIISSKEKLLTQNNIVLPFTEQSGLICLLRGKLLYDSRNPLRSSACTLKQPFWHSLTSSLLGFLGYF